MSPVEWHSQGAGREGHTGGRAGQGGASWEMGIFLTVMERGERREERFALCRSKCLDSKGLCDTGRSLWPGRAAQLCFQTLWGFLELLAPLSDTATIPGAIPPAELSSSGSCSLPALSSLQDLAVADK